MRKGLIIGALALAVVTSMTAGTLATYTKSADFSGELSAKRFYFGAASSETLNLTLAPGESQEWEFEATNENPEGLAPEVPLYLTVKVGLPKEMKDAGVKADVYLLLDGSSKKRRLPKLKDQPDAYLDYDFSPLTAPWARVTERYRVVFTWDNDEAANSVHTAIGEKSYTAPVTVTATGTQLISSVGYPDTE